MSSLKGSPFVFVYQVGDVFEAWTSAEYKGVQQHYADYDSIMNAIRGTSTIV
jgi:hypothetical protein